MKTKTFLSDLTPPRHTGLFAKLKGLRFMLVMILATLGVNVAFGALTAHEPGIYEKAIAKGGYGQTLASYNEDKYEVYGFSYNSSGSKPQILWAGTSTDVATASQVLCSTLSTTSQEIGGWISMSTAGKGSSHTNHPAEFDGIGSTGLYQMKMQGYTMTIIVKGYTSFGLWAQDNNATQSKNKYLKVEINGEEVTKDLSTSQSIRRYDLDPSIESTIVLTGLGTSNVFIYGFSLCLPAGAVDPVATFSNADYEIGGTLDLSTLLSVSTGNKANVTYSIKDANGTGAALAADGKTFSATTPGTATVTASHAAVTDQFNAGSWDATITVKAATPKYSVYFAAGDGTGTMDAVEYAEGAEVTLPACTFIAPSGKVFNAWTSSDVTITDGKFTMPANAVIVTATWKKAPIVLVGTTISASVEPLEDVVYGVDQTYTGGVYNVSGGMTGSSGKRYIKFTVPDGCTADVTVAGYGTANRFITLCTKAVFDGGSFTAENSIIRLDVNGAAAGAPVSASTTTPIEAGTYYVGSAGSGLNISTVSVMVNGSPVVIPTHHVTYAKGEVTCDITMPTQADVKENKTFTVADAIACDGYNFLGWNDGSADYAAGATYTMGTADVILTAQWEEITTSYTVTYNANGGTCATPSATWTGGDALVLPAAEFTDKLFDGWFDSEDNLIGKAGVEYTPTDNIELFAHYSYENKLKKAVFSNGFDAFINEDAKSVSVYYLDGTTEPTLATGTASIAACNVAEAEGKLVVTAPDETFVEYLLTKSAVTPATVGEYTFDAVPSWVKAPYGYDASKGIKFAKNAEDDRIQLGNTRQYYFVEACEKLVLHTASGITSDRNIFVYVNNVKVDAITKAPKYNAAGSYIEIPCNGSAAMVAVVSNQTGGDGGFGKADVVAHEVSNDATLSTLSVADNTIAPAFAAATYNYTCELPYGTAAVPAVSYTLNDANASAVKTDATSVTGATTIVVTAEDGTTQLTYTIQFSVGAAPAATPVITVQPASHDYLDTEVIDALTVEATVSDAGVLSYQWYKGEVAIAEATAASYTPTEAGSYKVVVTNTLGTETAEVESEVAVITISHIYTFASWTEGVSFTKTGEWTMTTSDGNGVAIEDAANTKFATDKQIDDATAKATAFTGQYFVVEFAKDMKKVELNAWRSSTTLNSGKVYVHNGTKFVEISYTANNSYLDPAGKKHIHKYVYDIHFEAGKTYFFKLGNAENIYDFFATESAKVSEFAGLTAGEIDGVAMTDAQLAELNGAAHTLTLEAASVAPAVKFTYKETETYDDEYVKTIVEVKDAEAVSARVGDNYEISKEIEGITYKVVVPVDVTPTLALDVTSGTAAISGKTDRSKEFTITLTGANLVDGNYNVTVPTVDGLTVTPAAFTVAAGEVNETFTITYASDADVAENTANIVFPVGATTATFTLTYSSVAWTAYTLQDVTGNMTWDFTNKAAADADKAAADADKGNYVVLANTDIKSTFANAEYMAANYNKYTAKSIQAAGLKIHTTVAGFVTVTFAQTGSDKVRELYLNDQPTGAIPSGTTNMTYTQFVKAGDVVLTSWEASTNKWQMFNYAKIEFSVPSYDATIRSGLTNGKLVTMCQAQSIEAMDGAVPFEVAEATAIGIDLVEATFPLVAGKPYILEANKADVRVVYGSGEAATEVVAANGLIGHLSTATDNIVIPTWTVEEQYYIFQNNHICKTSTGNYITRDRAYLRKDLVNAVAPAPGRRRISMTTDEVNTPTGLDALMQKADIQKVMIDGHVYIIREGKMFNAVGQMVK